MGSIYKWLQRDSRTCMARVYSCLRKHLPQFIDQRSPSRSLQHNDKGLQCTSHTRLEYLCEEDELYCGFSRARAYLLRHKFASRATTTARRAWNIILYKARGFLLAVNDMYRDTEAARRKYTGFVAIRKSAVSRCGKLRRNDIHAWISSLSLKPYSGDVSFERELATYTSRLTTVKVARSNKKYAKKRIELLF